MKDPDDSIIDILGLALGLVVVVLVAWGLASWTGSDFGRAATFMLIGYLIGYLVTHGRGA